MINIVDKQNCSGCGACAQKCPKHCISLQADTEGFLYPNVNAESCVDCGLCEKVCPVLSPDAARVPLQTFAAINKNEKIRMESSSGGIFTLLAESVIRDGGVVFGARYDDEWQVTLDFSETIEGLGAFRGSKYVQARTENSYIQCEKFLREGRRVLFSGTPCQISGLKHYLVNDYENLLTVDVVCHGTPSPKVWALYLHEVVGSVTSIGNISSMRDKSKGWELFSFVLNYRKDDDSLTLSVPFNKNEYMQAFIKNMILRPSCYNCTKKEFKCGSDFTIADYWGIQFVAPEMNDNKGTGLVFVNTNKALAYFSKLDLNKRETTYEEGIRGNSPIVQSVKPWYNRNDFFSKLDSSESVIALIQEELKPSPWMFCVEKIKMIMAFPKHMIKRLIGVNNVHGGNPLNFNLLYDTSADLRQHDFILHGRKVVLTNCNFRDKSTGWLTYCLTFSFKII